MNRFFLQGINDVAISRQAQILEEDRAYEGKERPTPTGGHAVAGACYGLAAMFQMNGDMEGGREVPSFWPGQPEEWTPSEDPRENLIRAICFMLAEVDAIDRTKLIEVPEKPSIILSSTG
jgi:hypothetical protein